MEAVFNGFIAFIGVHVGVSAPARAWVVQFHFYARARCYRSPAVATGVVQRGDKAAQAFGPHGDAASHAHREGDIDVVKFNAQRLPVPLQAARAYAVVVCAALDMAAAPLGHGPAFAGFAIQRYVERTVVFGLGHAAAQLARQCVVGRKHATHKGDDGQAMLAVVA